MVTCEFPLRIDSASWEILRIVHTIYFILQLLHLASKFQDSILILDLSSSCNGVERWNSGTSSILPFHRDFYYELHVIPNVHEEVVDLVVEVLLLERNKVLPLLRFNNFTQFLHTSSVNVGLEFVFLNLRLTVGEDLLFLSVQQSSHLCVSNV